MNCVQSIEYVTPSPSVYEVPFAGQLDIGVELGVDDAVDAMAGLEIDGRAEEIADCTADVGTNTEDVSPSDFDVAGTIDELAADPTNTDVDGAADGITGDEEPRIDEIPTEGVAEGIAGDELVDAPAEDGDGSDVSGSMVEVAASTTVEGFAEGIADGDAEYPVEDRDDDAGLIVMPEMKPVLYAPLLINVKVIPPEQRAVDISNVKAIQPLANVEQAWAHAV